MDDPADVSSENRPGEHLLDGCVSTRKRKVESSTGGLLLLDPLQPHLLLERAVQGLLVRRTVLVR
jgi:hypothetical protein